MPINARATTANYDDTRLDKPRAARFSITVTNQSVLYQINVPPFGTGETWQPMGGALLTPGLWNFDRFDFQEFGVDTANGIQFKAVNPADPGIVTVI